jgi:hypothetical protein
MIDVTELNEAIKEIGIQNIGWIAEADVDGGEYKCFVAPDQGDTFGFDEKKGFRADTNLYWDHYIIQPSAFDGLQDIVLVGKGPAYE